MTDRRTFLVGLSGLAGSALVGTAKAAMREDTAAVIAEKAPFGRHGFVLIDAESGKLLDRYSADDLFIPASLAKIPTSLTALHVHGPEKTFTTTLKIDGAVESGVLNGDLYLVGSGDPSLDTVDLVSLSRQLRNAGVQRINGRFLYYSGAMLQSEWLERSQPWQAPYNPSLGGLNLNYNRVQFKWTQQNGKLRVRGAAVSDGKIVRAPSVKFQVRNGGPEFRHETLETSEVWSLSQALLRNSGQRWLPVRRPGAFAAGVLRALCHEIGISLPEPEPATAKPGRDLAIHSSKPMFDLVHGMLRYSTNLTAEALGASVAHHVGYAPDTLEQAASLTTQLTAMQTGDIGGRGWDGFTLANHSGLSSQSRATPRQIAFTLREAIQRHGDSYIDLFNDRTLDRRRMNLPSGAVTPVHSIVAKTGTMHFVRGFAGHMRVGGRNLIFTFMASDDANRAAVDDAFTPFADATPRGSKQWLRRARAFEDAMLTNWIFRFS